MRGRFDVPRTTEEAIELIKEGLELAIYGQNNTKHLEGCPNVPMTCMRCVYDDDRKRFRKRQSAELVENLSVPDRSRLRRW